MLLAVLGAAVILAVLWDAFETIVVPKTVSRRFNFSTLYYRFVWRVWHGLVDHLPEGGLRYTLLVSFGPISLIFLFIAWSGVLVVAFGMVHWGAGTIGASDGFGDTLYFSGVTFFTLGYGDVLPVSGAGKLWSVVEAGTGFGFLAVVIGYVPTLYQSFSRRERFIVLLDSRAGSEPSGGELVRRHVTLGALSQLESTLKEAEVWAAEQLEDYLSHPILAYYRSQHDTQNWLKAITAILDACAVVLSVKPVSSEVPKSLLFQAKSTFAMARHVIVDLAYLLNDAPTHKRYKRIAPSDQAALSAIAEQAGWVLDGEGLLRLESLASQYEPYLVGLAIELHFSVPAWRAAEDAEDNWQRTAWEESAHF